jgi:hypothetical protein
MRGAFGAPRRDTRSPCLINKFRWRRDCLEPRADARGQCGGALRLEQHPEDDLDLWEIAKDVGPIGGRLGRPEIDAGRLLVGRLFGRLYWFRDLR